MKGIKRKKLFIIGSSPCLLMKALILKDRYDITIIEKNSDIGGAWLYTEKFGMIMDNGPHLLYTLRRDLSAIYSFLNKEIGVKFQVHSPQPTSEESIFFFNTPEFNYTHFVAAKTEKRYTRFVIQLFQTLKNKFSDLIFKNSKYKYLYIEGGTYQLLKKFKEKLKQEGIKLILKESINNIEIIEGAIFLKSKKNIYKADKILTTSRLDLKLFSTKSLLIKTHKKEETILMVVYAKIKTQEKLKFSYHTFSKNDAFYLISDITNTTQQGSFDSKIISIAMNKNHQNTNITKSSIEKQLRDKRILPNDFVIEDVIVDSFIDKKIDSKIIKAILENSKGKITFINHDNLTRCWLSSIQNRYL